jgi:hypothetical protein
MMNPVAARMGVLHPPAIDGANTRISWVASSTTAIAKIKLGLTGIGITADDISHAQWTVRVKIPVEWIVRAWPLSDRGLCRPLECLAEPNILTPP